MQHATQLLPQGKGPAPGGAPDADAEDEAIAAAKMSYDYLLSMPIYSLTLEKVQALQGETEAQEGLVQVRSKERGGWQHCQSARFAFGHGVRPSHNVALQKISIPYGMVVGGYRPALQHHVTIPISDTKILI